MTRLSDPSPCFPSLAQVFTYKQNALSRQKVQPMHHSSVRGVEDMSALEDLHDGAIMHNLFLRYQQRHIYVSPAALFLHNIITAVITSWTAVVSKSMNRLRQEYEMR